ncbi:glycosyltransferase [Leucobacter sp. W1153]|uniref:glycosyltransferase n=1 Tax=Leucobacter sp. W1153 TaxID=3439064 RepID=UPI003F406151
MRFGLAIAALVLSGIFLILGIGQRTFLAGPSEIVYETALEAETGFAVIPGEVLLAVPGQANVVVTGTAAFAATGSSADIAAWVEPFEHAEIDADPAESRLVGTLVPGAAQEAEEPGVPDDNDSAAPAVDDAASATTSSADDKPDLLDPRGSDLWMEERSLAPAIDSDTETDEAAGEATADSGSGSAGSDTGGKIRLPLNLDDGDAVLVSVDASTGDTGKVAIEWVQDQRTPLAGPFLAAGGLLAVVGAVLYLLAVDHDRRGLGPRRGRKGPLLGIRDTVTRRKRVEQAPKRVDSLGTNTSQATHQRHTLRRLALPSLGLVFALGLSGCSASYWPDFSPAASELEDQDDDGESAVAPVPVTRAQIDRIVGDIAAVAGEADDALDAEILESRFTGDALAQRSANYTIRQAVPDYAVVPPRITSEALGYELVQSTEGWPRTVFVTVASESGTETLPEEESEATSPPAEGEEGEASSETVEPAASPSLAIIMTQAAPHENFMVSRVISLRGGITMPEAAPAEEGTALLTDDLQTLVLSPGEVGSAYAAVLAGGPEVEQAALFDLDSDSLIERSGAAWAAQSQATADAAGQGVVYSVTAEQSDSKIISLSTGVGGALVATTVQENRIEEPGSSRWKPTPPASVTALSGLSGQQDRLVSEVKHQLLFFVPSKTSNAPIQLLGFASDLVGARN